ncbi:hypothetical protein D9M69_141600 [compost metagenome]
MRRSRWGGDDVNSQTFTSFDGRIGRQTWWLAQIVVWIATAAAMFAGAALLALSGVDNYAAGFSLMHSLVFIILIANLYFSFTVNTSAGTTTVAPDGGTLRCLSRSSGRSWAL